MLTTDTPPNMTVDWRREIGDDIGIDGELFRKRDATFLRVTLVDSGSTHFPRRPSSIRGAQSSKAFQTNYYCVLLAKGTLFALADMTDRRHGQRTRGLANVRADRVVSSLFHTMPKSLSTCRGKLRGC